MNSVHNPWIITLGSIFVDFATVLSSATAFWFHAQAALCKQAERRFDSFAHKKDGCERKDICGSEDACGTNVHKCNKSESTSGNKNTKYTKKINN